MLELILSTKPLIRLIHGDCMEFMAGGERFDLAVVDPPYGIGEGSKKILSRHHSQRKYHLSGWDSNAPNPEYFKLLQSVSENQIILGANHFIENIPNANSPCWIFWDKDTGTCDFADGELALTSFASAVRIFRFTWNGFRQGYGSNKEDRIHPTQKPVALYKWLLSKYAKQGDTILDTHLGSASSAIAAYDMGFDFTGIELDEEYFDAAVKRVKRFISEPKIQFPSADESKQAELF